MRPKAVRFRNRFYPNGRAAELGQALPFFAVMLAGLVMTAALVIDGGGTLVRHRQLQNAADAAATAASHQFGDLGCGTGATPRLLITSTAREVVRDHIPGFPDARITVTCPSGYDNYAVTVALIDYGQATFMRLMNPNGLQMTARASAINRPMGSPSTKSIMLLNPGNPSWSVNRGCPALLAQGAATITAWGGIQVNSSCSDANGHAVLSQGPAPIVLEAGQLTAVGSISATVMPAGVGGQPSLVDPYGSLSEPSMAWLPVRSSSFLSISGTQLLQPGIYRGGVEVKGTALLLPGIYYIDGGGFAAIGNGVIMSINAGETSATLSTWSSKCTVAACGVLIFNGGTASTLGGLEFGGNTSVKLRGYNAAADILGLQKTDYDRITIWQTKTPLPGPSYAQPAFSLQGRPGHELHGVVYLPSARLILVGAANYSLTVALVAWELEVIGSAEVRLHGDPNALPRQFDYGLVE